MGPKKCAKSETEFGGSATELLDTDLPTYGDIARYFYHVRIYDSSFPSQIQVIQNRLTEVWTKCNLQLPVKEKMSVYTKLKRFLERVKEFNWGRATASQRQYLQKLKNKLFDIAACSCSLPLHSCDSKFVGCDKEICLEHHILCECPIDLR
jgi:hypothetical protein